MEKRLYIKTYGCQMNVYDSSRMADVMAPSGFTAVDTPGDADMVILNTCHIREKAAEKLYSDLGRLRLIKAARAAEGKSLLITVAGCVAQAQGEEILARAPYVDCIVGPQSYHQLPELIENARTTATPQAALDFTEEAKFDLLPETFRPQGASAFVSIQEGCDKFCTFCVVPYTRGAEFSRPWAAIEREVKTQLDQGALEITLLGQNVNAYHGQDGQGREIGLAELLYRLAEIRGIKRLRYTTSHPRDMDEALIRAHGEIDILMPFLHLPVQSGHDRILKAMNRKHTAADYIAIIERLRAVRPEMAFSTDFIVGFPGESEAEFEASIALSEAVGFASAYSFKYSPRPGTPAAEKETQVPEAEKESRLARLQAALLQQQRRFNARTVGQVLPVLIEREGRKPGQVIGKSPYMQSVVIEHASAFMGQLAQARITRAGEVSVMGELLALPSAA